MPPSRREFLSNAEAATRYALALLTLHRFGLTKARAQPSNSLHPSPQFSIEAAAPPVIRSAMPASSLDADRMKALAAWTMLSMDTADPNPFGCEIVDTKTGASLMRAMNAVTPENDPSAHAEIRTIRLACHKLKSPVLAGYTLYTTCEPCPMCMSGALWAQVDRVVYGATIADANRFCRQIQIPASEVAKRSDMVCVVDGPIEREACDALFTNPKMQEAFKRWSSRK
jgi:tRNA(Arg) A34 adenosine deaminase TadA